MRTAEEILQDCFAIKNCDQYFGNLKGQIIKAINNARIEIVKEAAEVAKPGINACQVWNCESESSVNKRSILKLIDQIK